MKIFVAIAIFTCFFAFKGQSQEADSSAWSKKWHMSHSPLKATIFSAVIPGAGQIYNRKYWKAPIVWAGMGIATGFIIYNTNKYRTYRNALVAAGDADPLTINTTQYNSAQLNDLQDGYHKLMDISWFSLAGVYLLNIIDAHVDAHLWYFDVGDDVSLRLRPGFIDVNSPVPSLGMVLKF
jgi:hypothetical protein